MSRRRKTSVWWLLPVFLLVGYCARGRIEERAPVAEPVAAAVSPDGPAQERSDSRKIVGRVVSVADGDTITVLDENKTQIKVRLDAIDAPEMGQPFGQASKRALSEMVFGRDVVVYRKKLDRWGRTIGHVIVDRVDTNLAMLEAGMAWHYKQYDKNKRLAEAENEARAARRGLWHDSDSIAPWEWRKREREKKSGR